MVGGKMVMKLLTTLLMLSLCFPAYAAQTSKQTLVVQKKHMTTKQKQVVRKQLQSSKNKCYSVYDKKSKRNYVICK